MAERRSSPRLETRPTRVVLLAGALLVSAGTLVPEMAGADPLFFVPHSRKGAFGNASEDTVTGGLTVEVRMLGVAGARRLTHWSDGQVGLEPGHPQLVSAQVGGYLEWTGQPFVCVLRADLGELTRPAEPVERTTLAEIDRTLDDAYVMWRPVRPFHLVVGRARVPYSKTRQLDDSDQLFGTVPFLVDRVAPDRRWGATILGDLGSLSYAGGVYADSDRLEARVFEQDPSTGGRLAVLGHVEWTPRAPMYAANPPTRVPGAIGLWSTPAHDPWYDTQRVSLGLGTLWRVRKTESNRVDLSLSAHWKYRYLAALAEVLFAQDSDDAALGFAGAHAEIFVAPADTVALSALGEWDAKLGEQGRWTAGAGFAWHATPDRRNKIGFLGFFRRDVARDTPYDGAIVYIQAAL